MSFRQRVLCFKLAHPDTNPAGRLGINLNDFCRGAVPRSEYTPELAVKKKLNFMSASNPMLLDSHLFASVFLGLLFYILRPGKQNAAQLTVLE